MIFQCPRRTCNYLFDVTMLSLFGNTKIGFKKEMSFSEIKEKIKPLILDELENKDTLIDPYIACINFNDKRLPDYWKDFDKK